MDKRALAVALLEIASLPLLALSTYAAPIPIAIAGIDYARNSRAGKSDGLLHFCKELLSQCNRSSLGAALHNSCMMRSAPKELVLLDRRIRSGAINLDTSSINDPEVSELASIIAFGFESGKDIRKNLEIFASRLEERRESSARLMQNSLNMETLSSIGVMFFIPLFAGIGATIIGASGAIGGDGLNSIKIPFELAMVAYVGIMCYISSMFKPSNDTEHHAFSAIRGIAFGSALIRASTFLMSYVV